MNENGCQDTDGDGISDDIDTCPDNAEGIVVNANGCSDLLATLGSYYQGGILVYLLKDGDLGYVTGEEHGIIIAEESYVGVFPNAGKTRFIFGCRGKFSETKSEVGT